MYSPARTGIPADALSSAWDASGASGMEPGPAAFAGVVLAVFGAALLLWTSLRLRVGKPVADGVPSVTGAVLGVFFGVISLMTGCWTLLSA